MNRAHRLSQKRGQLLFRPAIDKNSHAHHFHTRVALFALAYPDTVRDLNYSKTRQLESFIERFEAIEMTNLFPWGQFSALALIAFVCTSQASDMTPQRAFEVLNISATDTDKMIKDQYKRLVKLNHPDVGGSALKFREIQEAYNLLERRFPYMANPPGHKSIFPGPAAASCDQWLVPHLPQIQTPFSDYIRSIRLQFSWATMVNRLNTDSIFDFQNRTYFPGKNGREFAMGQIYSEKAGQPWLNSGISQFFVNDITVGRAQISMILNQRVRDAEVVLVDSYNTGEFSGWLRALFSSPTPDPLEVGNDISEGITAQISIAERGIVKKEVKFGDKMVTLDVIENLDKMRITTLNYAVGTMSGIRLPSRVDSYKGKFGIVTDLLGDATLGGDFGWTIKNYYEVLAPEGYLALMLPLRKLDGEDINTFQINGSKVDAIGFFRQLHGFELVNAFIGQHRLSEEPPVEPRLVSEIVSLRHKRLEGYYSQLSGKYEWIVVLLKKVEHGNFPIRSEVTTRASGIPLREINLQTRMDANGDRS